MFTDTSIWTPAPPLLQTARPWAAMKVIPEAGLRFTVRDEFIDPEYRERHIEFCHVTRRGRWGAACDCEQFVRTQGRADCDHIAAVLQFERKS